MNAAENTKRNSLANQAYEQIKAMIVSGSLKPGETVNNIQMQEKTGLGRTPIHEAFLKLQQENFVVIVPRKGVKISKLSLKRIHDIFELRMILEPAILKKYGDSIDIKWLEQMESDFTALVSGKENILDIDVEKEDIIRANELDSEFHSKFAEISGNDYAKQVLDGFSDQMAIVRNIATNSSRRFIASTREHLNILDAIQKRNMEEASRLLHQHLKISYEDVVLAEIDDRW